MKILFTVLKLLNYTRTIFDQTSPPPKQINVLKLLEDKSCRSPGGIRTRDVPTLPIAQRF